MAALHLCLRPLYRIRYATPGFISMPPIMSTTNHRRRVVPISISSGQHHFLNSGTSPSSNNADQQHTTTTTTNVTSPIPSSSYVMKPSSSSILTLHDRVQIISLGQGIIHVLLSRPDKLNSLDMPMFEAIADAAYRLKHDATLRKNLRVVIISGEGRAFCTGLDAKNVVLSGSPSASMKKLLERPSAYGGETGLGNLAQDVCYLWRWVWLWIRSYFHYFPSGDSAHLIYMLLALSFYQRVARPCHCLSSWNVFWGR